VGTHLYTEQGAVLDVLNEHIEQLKKFKESIEKGDDQSLRGLIEDANKIRRILR
jgi:prephenate dehydrogenase